MTHLPEAILFQDVPMQVFDREGVPWLRASQIALALGYTKGGGQTDTPLAKKAIKRLFDRHADEFSEDMTALVTVETAGGPQEVRVFSPRGCHLLAMLARTDRAKEFRKWVLDVLENLGGLGPSNSSMDELHELVALWAMLAELPRQALLRQVLSRFHLTGNEQPGGAVAAAARFVIEQNDALLRKGRKASPKAVRQYEAFAKGEEEEPALVTAFWQQFDLLNSQKGPDGQGPGWLNHSRTPALLAVNLPQFMRASQARGLFVFDAPELRLLLRASTPRKLVEANKAMNSGHMGKTLKCWVFFCNQEINISRNVEILEAPSANGEDAVQGGASARGERPETETHEEARA